MRPETCCGGAASAGLSAADSLKALFANKVEEGRALFPRYEGQVVEHPLADWRALDTYRAPDPMTTGDRGPVDWEDIRQRIVQTRARGGLTREKIMPCC